MPGKETIETDTRAELAVSAQLESRQPDALPANDIALPIPANDNLLLPPDDPPPAAPAAARAIVIPYLRIQAHARRLALSQIKRRLAAFVSSELPALNNAAEGAFLPDVFADAIMGVIEPKALSALLAGGDAVTPGDARALLGLVGFLVSSFERHIQTAQGAPGSGLERLPGVAAILRKLGEIARCTPRDDHDTYWIDNVLGLSFTGHASETYFRESVCLTNSRMHEVADLLKPLRTGLLSLSDLSVRKDLAKAKIAVDSLIHQFRGFHKNMTPSFFAERMRTYLLAYPVDGIATTGPNATNAPGWVRADYAMGTYEPRFLADLRKRATHMAARDREQIAYEAGLPSLSDMVRAALVAAGSSSGDGISGPVALTALDGETRANVHAAAALARTYGQFAMVHWAMIVKFLVRAPIAGAQPAQSTGHGVSGTPLEHTKMVSEMRARSWLCGAWLDETGERKPNMSYMQGDQS